MKGVNATMTSTSQAWWWFIMTQDFHFTFFIKSLNLIKKIPAA